MIEKNHPMPKTNGRGAPRKYPFYDMDIGDSVFFDGAKTGGKEYLAAQQVGIKMGWKFSGRKEENGVRIWRVA